MDLLRAAWNSLNLIFVRFFSIFNSSNRLTGDVVSRGVKVNVKYGPKMLPMVLERETTVSELKTRLQKQLSVPEGQKLGIIFAGKRLADDLSLEECDVANHTTLNAVCTRDEGDRDQVMIPSDQRPLKDSVVKIQCTPTDLETLGNDISRVLFFVYCNRPCQKVSPGKLRVRCSLCKQGTLIVNQDPSCWEDVLMPNRISGTCESLECSGLASAEFFFKCASLEHPGPQEEEAVVLHHIKNNFKEIPCLACQDTIAVVLVFPCQAGHVICLDCFRDYCLSRLSERGFVTTHKYGYTLNCPVVGCNESFIEETHHFRILSEEQYARYQRFSAEDYLLSSGGILCPRPGCGAGILPDPNCQRIICIQGCGFVFCRRCLQGYHLGECQQEPQAPISGDPPSYLLNAPNALSSQWELASVSTIKEITKPCPSCRTPTERNGGCMHMVCTRAQCGYHWCWVCQDEWKRECMGNHWFG